ncbi:MAG: Glycine rich protein [Actinomycetota bacterium]|nr:Glycine rich protein [Actinomycetota bacterium]
MVAIGRVRLLRIAAAAALFSAIGAAPSEARAATPTPSYVARCGVPDLSTGARTCSYTFTHNRTVETFVVPPTTGPVEITAVGAPGFGEDALRSRGARVTGTFSILSGTPLFVAVGGDGFYDGYNGGVDGGGGASDIRLGVPARQHRISVAGGGGGAGEQLISDQQQSIWRFAVVPGGDAGQPGNASAGGEGGGRDPARGGTGRLGWGGGGADPGGGGGGGGLYGGGGGGGCAGGDDAQHLCTESQPGSGGGGSSLVPPGGTVTISNVLEPSITITLTQLG